MKHQKEI